jgi:hypothetical protein
VRDAEVQQRPAKEPTTNRQGGKHMAIARKQGRSKQPPSQRHAVSRATQAHAGDGTDTEVSTGWMDERRVGVSGTDETSAQRERGVAVNSRPKTERRGRAKESRRGQQ